MKISMKKLDILIVWCAVMVIIFGARTVYAQNQTVAPSLPATPVTSSEQKTSSDPESFYIDFVKKVYGLLDQNYYTPIPREKFEEYLQKYKQAVLDRLPPGTPENKFIAYKGAGLMVELLREPDDIFTAFMPPAYAKKFEAQALSYNGDLGITTHRAQQGYLIDYVEKHSEAFLAGVRKEMIITRINNRSVLKMDDDTVKSFLFPPLETKVTLTTIAPPAKNLFTFQIVCKEYFKESVKEVPTGVKDVYCLQMSFFNKLSGPDLRDAVAALKKRKMKRLILDFRQNGGGPTLACIEAAGIFLKPETHLFYLQKRSEALPAVAPGSDVTYDGPLTILVSKNTGSSGEIFPSVLQAHQRAKLIGVENTAGKTWLKSMFNLDDGSMLLCVTAVTCLFNDKKLSADGTKPDIIAPSDNDMIRFAALQP